MIKASSTNGAVLLGKDMSNSITTVDETMPSIMSLRPLESFKERHENFLAEKGPAVQIEEIKQVFDFLDENADGQISTDDLRHFLQKLNFETTEEEVSSMLSSVDEDGDGSVDFKEFCTLFKSFSSYDGTPGEGGDEDDCEEDLKEAFHVFDKNDDGVISPTELQEVLVNLGIDGGESLLNCERMIERVDADHNGSVDFAEFKVMMSSGFDNSRKENDDGMISPNESRD